MNHWVYEQTRGQGCQKCGEVAKKIDLPRYIQQFDKILHVCKFCHDEDKALQEQNWNVEPEHG